jgi:hypothetical protein
MFHVQKALVNYLLEHLIAQLGYKWNIHVITELAARKPVPGVET